MSEEVETTSGVGVEHGESDFKQLGDKRRSPEGLDDLHDMGEALFGVKMAEAEATGSAGGKDDCTGCGGCKATLL